MKRKISLYLMKHDRSEKMNYNKEPERERDTKRQHVQEMSEAESNEARKKISFYRRRREMKTRLKWKKVRYVGGTKKHLERK